ncbi:MAG: hypothetical protein C5B48_10965 [Candidatus Rokuibacteriota bacterium]|nr:MAG: hypothetical protein C5B48_10965 [Candidatus Rokubacteria bacterium]
MLRRGDVAPCPEVGKTDHAEEFDLQSGEVVGAGDLEGVLGTRAQGGKIARERWHSAIASSANAVVFGLVASTNALSASLPASSIAPAFASCGASRAFRTSASHAFPCAASTPLRRSAIASAVPAFVAVHAPASSRELAAPAISSGVGRLEGRHLAQEQDGSFEVMASGAN